MFGLQHYLVVLCMEAPLLPLTYFSGERSRAPWALLLVKGYIIYVYSSGV